MRPNGRWPDSILRGVLGVTRWYKPMQPARTLRSAFTLIELLVTLAIIAILASLLLTAISRAKKSAQTARCKSNLRQLTLALSMYVSDQAAYPRGWWNDFPAPGEKMNMRGDLNRFWWGNLFEYCAVNVPSDPN